MALGMGFEDLATQVILIGSRHHFLRRRESPLLHYTIIETALEVMGWSAPRHQEQTIPGIGPLAASALEDSAGNGHQFANGRFFAAWLGFTPREYSTGGKTTLLGISKRGNTYLRRILIHGARSCVQTCDRQRHPLGTWITKLEQRMHRNKVIVALANKIARVAWKILTKPEEIYRWAAA